MQPHALLPAADERVDLLVAREDLGQVRRVEQREHGQVGLAVPAVRGGIDEHRLDGVRRRARGGARRRAVDPQHVPGPEIAVQASGHVVRRRARQARQPSAHGVDGPGVAVVEGSPGPPLVEQRTQPCLGVELQPGAPDAARHRQRVAQRAEPAVRSARPAPGRAGSGAEGGSAGVVQRGQGSAEGPRGRGRGRHGAEAFEVEVARPGVGHLDDPWPARHPQPLQAGGLTGEEAVRRVRTRLAEHAGRGSGRHRVDETLMTLRRSQTLRLPPM
jgi:hypothetical protein